MLAGCMLSCQHASLTSLHSAAAAAAGAAIPRIGCHIYSPLPPPSRPDIKNGLYQDSIRKGDLLLNRVQKLSRIIDVE